MYDAGSGFRVVMVALLVLLVAVWSLAVPPAEAAAPTRGSVEADAQPTPSGLKIVTVDSNSSDQLWPYTSRRKTFDSATLPINVIVFKDAAYVRHLLGTTTDAKWETTAGNATVNGSLSNESTVESGVVLNGSDIEWSTARGATRYTYLHNRQTGRGRWIDETYQLHDGTYLGTRYHVRLYEGGTDVDRWTAIQIHREHWDWFRLRHTIDSVDRAQDHFEREFFGTWYLDRVTRVRIANAGALDSDGWASFIHLTNRGVDAPAPASLVFVIGALSLRQLTDRSAGPTAVLKQLARSAHEDLTEFSFDPRYLPLVASLALFPLVIRLGGVTAEQTLPGLSPKIIAAVLYPVIVFGIPAVTIAFAWRLHPQPSAVASALSFGAGLLFDYAYLDISALPIDVVVHRSVLLVAVALLAAGGSLASREELSESWLVAVGGLLWLVGLAVPLFGLA